MTIILSVILVILGILDISVGMLSFTGAGSKSAVNRTFFLVGLTGSFWCLGYALMGISPNDTSAYCFRAIGLFGVYSCCGCILRYIQLLSGIRFKHQLLFARFVIIAGAISYILIIIPKAVTFVETPYGRYYTSNPWIGRYIQYFYLLVLIWLWFYLSHAWGQRAEYKREKAMARSALISGVVLILGMVFDTILPMCGLPAIPSSAATTFFFVVILYRSLKQHNSISLASSTVSQKIFQAVATPVLVLNDKLDIMDCNNNACVYFNMKMPSLLESNAAELVIGLGEKEIDRIHSELVNLSQEFSLNVVVKSTGNRCVVAATPVYDEYQQTLCIICILNDRTKLEDMELNLEKSKKQLEVSEYSRVAFLDGINANLVNRVKNIGTYLESLPMDDALEELVEENRSLQLMLDDMVDLSRMYSKTYELNQYRYDIEKLLVEVIDELAPKVDETRVLFTTHISPSLPKTLIGDRERVKRLIYTFISNAIKYTEDGYVAFYLSYKIRFGIVTLLMRVSDSGQGMKEQDVDVIFGSGASEGKKMDSNIGTSLELTICRRLIKLMGGNIKVQSAVGRGSSFIFEIEQKTDSEHSIVPYGDYAQYVLMIDDNQTRIDVVANTLHELGIKCDVLLVDGTREININPEYGVTTILVGAGVYGRNRNAITESAGGRRIIPLYSYQNYMLLEDKSQGMCLPLFFKQVENLL